MQSETSSLSQLQFYSIGIVAANKIISSKDIEVVPMEHTPLVSGELTDNVSKYKAKSKGAMKDSFSIEIDTTLSIQATWLPLGNSNRYTAPDVRRGEMVAIYRFSDTDQFWWNTLKNDSKLRRLETVIYAFSNNSKEDVENDENSTYFFEVSTHKKTITVHTSNNDGEPTTFDIQINAGEGKIIIQDDKENFILLDSVNNRLLLKNGDNSFVDINKKSISIISEELINIFTKNLSVTAKTIVVNSETTNITANAFTLTSPIINFNGNIAHAGNMVTTGAIQAAMMSAPTMSGGSVSGTNVTATNGNITNITATNISAAHINGS
jgi:hypothetical protein